MSGGIRVIHLHVLSIVPLCRVCALRVWCVVGSAAIAAAVLVRWWDPNVLVACASLAVVVAAAPTRRDSRRLALASCHSTTTVS